MYLGEHPMYKTSDQWHEPISQSFSGKVMLFRLIVFIIGILILVLCYQFFVLQAMVTGTLIKQVEEQNRQLSTDIKRQEAEINLTLNDPALRAKAYDELNLRIPEPDQIVAIYNLSSKSNKKTQTIANIDNQQSTIGEKLLKSVGVRKLSNGDKSAEPNHD